MDDRGHILLSFYGDDFTGSTDAMDALVRAGVPTTLFLRPPDAEQLARHRDARAVGVAGLTRSMSADAMMRELDPALGSLSRLGASLLHYKVCSTFDSSPAVGSIGRAIEIGRQHVRARCIPLLVGAPALGRYTVFGNLFARSGGDAAVHRLDRHPTMSRHPITPMDEADLARHLARQTSLPIALFSMLDYAGSPAQLDARLDALLAGATPERPRIVLFDILEDSQLPIIGRLLWQRGQREPMLVVGSSGVEYALAAHWREAGVIDADAPAMTCALASRVIAISGSCSPVTARQLDQAAAQRGFAEVPVDIARLASAEAAARESDRVVQAMVEHVRAGCCPIAHLARGPDDPRIAEARQRGIGPASLGRWLGQLACHAVAAAKPQRVIVTGGDSSGHVARALGIEALTMLAPLAPGVPLCRAHGPRAASAGDIEICFKGGQLGGEDIFAAARRGGQG
ncbi:MAG: four-carbon acid sugar kinase family protein [Phycisphaeraceae bacterium]